MKNFRVVNLRVLYLYLIIAGLSIGVSGVPVTYAAEEGQQSGLYSTSVILPIKWNQFMLVVPKNIEVSIFGCERLNNLRFSGLFETHKERDIISAPLVACKNPHYERITTNKAQLLDRAGIKGAYFFWSRGPFEIQKIPERLSLRQFFTETFWFLAAAIILVNSMLLIKRVR